MATKKSIAPLRQLVTLMSQSLDAIEHVYETAKLEFPDLNAPFDPTNPSDALGFTPSVVQHAVLIVAAAGQLSAAVRPPPMNACRGRSEAVLKANIPEIVREAGENGIHTRDIGKLNGLDPRKMSRLLRVLATHHVFCELEPDVFAHTRLSSLLDTMKPASQLISGDPKVKHVGTPGFAAIIGHLTDESFKSAAYTADIVTDPRTAFAEEATDSPFHHVFNTKLLGFEWMSQPENAVRGARFNAAMTGLAAMDNAGSMLGGFPWDSLPKTAKVVDVGGGVGSVSVLVSRVCPEMQFVVQDMPNVIESASQYLKAEAPDAYESGRIVFQGHDFFQPQPIKDADLFLLRMITHDWSNKNVIKILKHLRDAATAGKTRLLIVDQLLPYACEDNTSLAKAVGLVARPVPAPLLPNLGRGNSIPYMSDWQMYAFGGQERTLGDFDYVTSESGWKLSHVYAVPGSIFTHVAAEAV